MKRKLVEFRTIASFFVYSNVYTNVLTSVITNVYIFISAYVITIHINKITIRTSMYLTPKVGLEKSRKT